MMGENYIICGDIGGTNSRFQLYKVSVDECQEIRKRTPGKLVAEKQYLNQDYTSFVDVVKAFLCDKPASEVKAACFAVAGPVDDNEVTFTNRTTWVIKGKDLEQQLNIPRVQLINDFVANGYGLLTLGDDDVNVLQKAEPNPDAPIALVGAGTGLGECFLVPTGDKNYRTFPAEGGHVEFAPRNETERALLVHLSKKFNHRDRISVERVVSGPGIANVYEFLAGYNNNKPDEKVAALIAKSADKGEAIASNINNCDVCAKTMDIFFASYGAECGNAALKFLPYGGFYIAGGIAPKNYDALLKSRFLEAFFDKGRVSPTLKRIPIYVVMAQDIGQRGAHYFAFKLFKESK